MKKNIKDIITGFLVIIIYFGLPYLCVMFYSLLNVDIASYGNNVKIIYLLSIDILKVGLILILLRNKLKSDVKDFKEKNRYYFKDGIKYWLAGLALMMISNLIINAFSSQGIANNEDAIRKIFDISPLYVFATAVIIAPICEELTFRLGIRKIFKNNILFILISGILFGGIHVISTYKTLYDLLYIIPYSALGISFAYMLKKYNNIFVSMWFHFMHNGLLMALQFLVLFFS